MRRILPSSIHLPLHGLAASRAWESEALALTPPHALMARAGLAVAKLALALYPAARRIALFCGPGNNGGDALLAAQHLARQGRLVQLWMAPQAADAGHSRPADAAWALEEARRAGLSPQHSLPQALDADLVIDGLLGLGAARAPTGWLAEAIALINRQRAPVLAIDLPSGLDGQHGSCAGAAVQAQHCLSLLTLKPGLFTAQGRALSGDIWWDDLAHPSPHAPSAWLLGNQALREWQDLLGPRGHASHKGSWGDVLVIGGAPGMRGAAQLASQAALAAGAGRVYVGLLEAKTDSPLGRPELMHWHEAQLAEPASWSQHTVVAGCGGASLMARVLPQLLAHASRLVLDADALNALAAEADLRSLLRARAAQRLATVLTPHPLEAARLLGSSSQEVQADRLGAAQALAMDLACCVVLKGSGSVIASPGSVCAINSSGNGRLASAGTGDVLAGWLGGLWAQLPPQLPHKHPEHEALHTLACAAVYWHGAAASGAEGGPLRAAELIERMLRLHPQVPD